MKVPSERLFADYERTLRAQRFRAEDLDLGRLNCHLPLLERLDAVEGRSAVLYDLPAAERKDYKLAFDFRIRRAGGRRSPQGTAAGRAGLGGAVELTRREVEVLGLVAVGMASREIADRLYISTATVNNHRQRILEKTGARNSSEAARYAARLGIL